MHRQPVTGSHRVVELQLAHGPTLRISPRHPTADGRHFADLAPGDLVDGVRVIGARLVDYDQPFTYDILPDSDSGTYFAGGTLIGDAESARAASARAAGTRSARQPAAASHALMRSPRAVHAHRVSAVGWQAPAIAASVVRTLKQRAKTRTPMWTRSASPVATTHRPAIRSFTPARRPTNAARPTAASISPALPPASRKVRALDADSSEPRRTRRRTTAARTRWLAPVVPRMHQQRTVLPPNRCLNITGSPACQVEGPARSRFTSWTSCGWTARALPVRRDARRARRSPAEGFLLGSQQARVGAIDGDVCEYVVFVETEGGGTARRCRVPINADRA